MIGFHHSRYHGELEQGAPGTQVTDSNAATPASSAAIGQETIGFGETLVVQERVETL
jgi:hypothetical protein